MGRLRGCGDILNGTADPLQVQPEFVEKFFLDRIAGNFQAVTGYSGFLSRKYGSTVPLSLMVNGLPKRSLALPAATRIQPSLTQYSSTLVFSAPLKRMPMSCASTSALKWGLRASVERRTGRTTAMAD